MSNKKPSYDDLVEMLKKIYVKSRVEDVLGIEWANYPVEVFDELIDLVTEIDVADDPRL